MYLTNLPTILQMICDKNVRSFLKSADNHFEKTDSRRSVYSKFQMLKTALTVLRGEKIVKHEDKYIFTSFLPPVPSAAFKNGIRSGSKSYGERISSKRDAPVSMYMAITKRCPYRCDHCSAAISSEKNELSTEAWKKIISDLQDMGVGIIGITGGEPLVRNDVEELVGAIDSRSMSYLFTTGVGLTLDKARRLKERGLFAVGISLDSYREEVHNARRHGNRAFELALTGIKNAKAAGLYTMAQIVLYKNQLDQKEFFNYLSFVKKLGVNEVRVLEPIRCGELIKENDNVFYSAKDREHLIEMHFAANRRPWFPKVTTFAYTESKERFGCGAGMQHSYLNEKGELFPCDFVPMSFGNVMENGGVAKLWKEMSQIVGLPKPHCFAQVVNKDLWATSKGVLPLGKAASTELCLKYRQKDLLGIFKQLQRKDAQISIEPVFGAQKNNLGLLK